MSTDWSFARQTLKKYLPSVTMPSVPSAPMKLCARWEDGGQPESGNDWPSQGERIVCKLTASSCPTQPTTCAPSASS